MPDVGVNGANTVYTIKCYPVVLRFWSLEKCTPVVYMAVAQLFALFTPFDYLNVHNQAVDNTNNIADFCRFPSLMRSHSFNPYMLKFKEFEKIKIFLYIKCLFHFWIKNHPFVGWMCFLTFAFELHYKVGYWAIALPITCGKASNIGRLL